MTRPLYTSVPLIARAFQVNESVVRHHFALVGFPRVDTARVTTDKITKSGKPSTQKGFLLESIIEHFRMFRTFRPEIEERLRASAKPSHKEVAV
ncbi:hypothetical protein [Pseudoruegeria sp. HB172150]|uniref:hypothetical protein n=1 Tax=Pseudoruegeria sp. HB172150 TaxID=2721164 RepID=UPI001557469E|nr:hypothetical protein [Pseudoruegeria sp. HB172150]